MLSPRLSLTNRNILYCLWLCSRVQTELQPEQTRSAVLRHRMVESWAILLFATFSNNTKKLFLVVQVTNVQELRWINQRNLCWNAFILLTIATTLMHINDRHNYTSGPRWSTSSLISNLLHHHVSMSTSRPADTFICAWEPGICHSPDAILVKLSDCSTVGHVPDALARVLAFMLDIDQLTHMEWFITAFLRSAPEGVWVPGGGMEIPCECILLGARKYYNNVR